MKNINVVDVTLRDGGCVNDFNFGYQYMKQILEAEEQAKIDIIEIGYIDDKNGSINNRTKYLSEKYIKDSILHSKKDGITYVAMIDYGKYDFNNLSEKDELGIDGIRLAFHKKDRNKIFEIADLILKKGYLLFLQPMLTLTYSEDELESFLKEINRKLPQASAVYIVDSFGEMRPNEMKHIFEIYDKCLLPEIPIGFHSHNNLQLSYSNAMSMLEFKSNRNLYIDCSIMGMGKGAGNLNTELLLEHLNLFYNKNYNISPLLKVIDEVVNQLHSEFYWGYAPEYYLSSVNHCTPSYAKHFYSKHMLPIDKVGQLLSLIEPEKKISFDKEYAEKLYKYFNEKDFVDDMEAFESIKNSLHGKDVLLLGPGKSILSYEDSIDRIILDENTASVSLNVINDKNYDYNLITRKELLDNYKKSTDRLIVTSNVDVTITKNVLNYKNWIDIDGEIHDSSLVIALNLIRKCGVKHVFLAGIDGFSSNINENYYDPAMRHPVTDEQAENRNNYYKNLISRFINSGMDITFLTPSKYEEA